MPSALRSSAQAGVLRARRAFALRYGLLGFGIVLGVFLGLVVPAIRQKPFSITRVGVSLLVLLLGVWSWGTLMRDRLRDKE